MKRRQLLKTTVLSTAALILGNSEDAQASETFEYNGVRITPSDGDYVAFDGGESGCLSVLVVVRGVGTNEFGYSNGLVLGLDARINRMVKEALRELSEEGWVVDCSHDPRVSWGEHTDVIWDAPYSFTPRGYAPRKGEPQGRIAPEWITSDSPSTGVLREAEGIAEMVRCHEGWLPSDESFSDISLQFRMKADLNTRKGRDLFRAHLAAKALQS